MDQEQGSPRAVHRVLWGDALEAAALLIDRCSRAAAGTFRVPTHERELNSYREVWALPIYALAGDMGSPALVKTEHLRYILEDGAGYTDWLCAQLRAMGHDARLLEPPQRGLAGDVEAAERMLAALHEARHPAADDPVAKTWRLATVVTATTSEMSDGTIVQDPPDCRLWNNRWILIDALDKALVGEREAWPTGTAVRTVGVPPYIGPSYDISSTLRVASDRAVISRPAWQCDHEHRTLRAGLPPAYWVEFRYYNLDLDRRGHRSSAVGPVAAQHLLLDHDPFPEHTDVPAAILEQAVTRAANARDHASDRDLPPDISDLSLTGPRGPRQRRDVPGVPSTIDDLRAYAIGRVWALRDQELRVGDTAPRRIAERLVKRQIPEPPPDLTSRALAQQDETALLRKPPPPNARWCRPDQHLVTGRSREVLLRWLELMQPSTRRQIQALDGLSHESTVDDIRVMLDEEGFLELRRIDSSAVGGTSTLAVHPHNGWLAETFLSTYDELSLTIYFNAEVLDFDILLHAGVFSGLAHTHLGERTNITHGTIRMNPRQPSYGLGSVRLQLALLTAFSNPVTPWFQAPYVHLGHDGTPVEETHRILSSLPQPVHELIGPGLLPRLGPGK